MVKSTPTASSRTQPGLLYQMQADQAADVTGEDQDHWMTGTDVIVRSRKVTRCLSTDLHASTSRDAREH